jgi:hypothetical protein
MTYQLVCNKRYTTDVTSGAATVNFPDWNSPPIDSEAGGAQSLLSRVNTGC